MHTILFFIRMLFAMTTNVKDRIPAGLLQTQPTEIQLTY